MLNNTQKVKRKNMTMNELKVLFQELEKQNLRPMLCDTEIPKYDASVPCGNPCTCYEENMDMALFPKELMSLHPEFMVSVKGDSMKDVDILTGDVVKVVADATLYDCDIVLAYIDGEYTLKAYCEDEDGRKWLVPQNEAYSPILLDEKQNVRIYGKVAQVVKRAPRVSYKQCMKAIRKVQGARCEEQVPTQEKVSRAIREIAPKVTFGRLWYAVYRAMADAKVTKEGDYGAFCSMIREVVPDHAHLPTRIELQRLGVLSFSKPVVLWDAGNAPVQGKRFCDYKIIAEEMKGLLKK